MNIKKKKKLMFFLQFFSHFIFFKSSENKDIEMKDDVYDERTVDATHSINHEINNDNGLYNDA